MIAVKTLAASLVFAALMLTRSADAIPVTQGEIYIYNVESPTNFPFAIIDGASHHAYVWDLVNGYSIENATLDWIPLGDYLCLAGQRCVLSGDGIRLVDFDFVTLTTPMIDFWGQPLDPPAAVPEPATWLLMATAAVALIATRYRRQIPE